MNHNQLEAEIIKEFKIKFLGLQDYEGRFLIERKEELNDFLKKALKRSAKAAVESVKVDKMTDDQCCCYCDGSGDFKNGYCNCEFSIVEGHNGCLGEQQKLIEKYFNNK